MKCNLNDLEKDEEEIDALTYDEETIALIRREWEEVLNG